LFDFLKVKLVDDRPRISPVKEVDFAAFEGHRTFEGNATLLADIVWLVPRLVVEAIELVRMLTFMFNEINNNNNKMLIIFHLWTVFLEQG